jgi:hypothetical protein
MPSLKKSSPTRKRRHDGGGGQMLINAINMLFQIKGKEYQKKHPEFLIPAAEEFFGYVRRIDAEFIKHHQVVAKRKNIKFRQITPNKDILLVSPSGAQLSDFISFILKKPQEESICDRFFACVLIVMYAVSLWLFLEQYMILRNSGKTVSFAQILSSDTYKTSFADPVRWFFTHTMTSLVHYKNIFAETCFNFLRLYLFPILTPGDASFDGIIRTLTVGFDTFLSNPNVYNKSFRRPVGEYLLSEGFMTCKVEDELPTGDHAHDE